MLVPIIGIGVAFILTAALTICVLGVIYQIIKYNLIKNELPYFDQETSNFLFITIKTKIEKTYGYIVDPSFALNGFYVDGKLFYTFDRLTYNNFFDFLKKRKIPDLRFTVRYWYKNNWEDPDAKYKDFYEMFNDIPNQMKMAIRKEKLMKIQNICKEED